MDIALKLKRAVATVAAGAIFASSAGAALAQTFNDVSTDAWYYDFVEQLVDDGVIDAADNYNPANNLNRAELVKMAVVAIDGLAGYEAPATPTFEDVPADAWFFDYVEAASQLGIVNGYTDANGNLTGFFGPGDLVNRAAATKVLVNAFSVPTDLSPASVFPDVSAGDWFYEYVTTAYNQSIVDGYANGNFGPADFVTRAQTAKLVVNSQNPVERMAEEEEMEEEMEEEEMEEEETSSSSDGDLEVSLNDNTPASSTLPISANGVALASFDFTADSDDVLITNLVVTRGGVGDAQNWEDLYIYHGANRLTTGRTLNNDTNTATFPLDVLVEAGTTATLTLVGDVASATEADPSSQHYFYVASAADVTSNAQSVAGDFPVAGNTFTMGGASTVVNTVLIEPGTAPSTVTLGETDAEIASIRIEAGSENDVAVHQLALTNGGALSSAKLANLTLLRGTDVVATAEGFMNDIVTFVLDTPYVIEEGQTKTFYVNADIIGGRTTDNIVLYLDEDTDLVAVDQQYGFGAAINNQFTQGQANTVNLEGGDVTVTDNGPAATQLATDSTNNELLNVSVTSGRDLTVRDTQVLVRVQDANGNTPTFTAGNTTTTAAAITLGTNGCAATEYDVDLAAATNFTNGDMFLMGTLYGRVSDTGNGTDFCAASANDLATVASGSTVTEVNPYTYVEDLKIVDLNTGATLAGPLTEADDADLCTAANTPNTICAAANTYAEVFTEDYELTGGETRHLSIQVDLEQELVTGYQVSAAIQWPDTGAGFSAIKDLDANEFVTTSEVIGAGTSALTGDLMIVTENSLAVSVASTPTSNDYVRGDESVPALGISMTAGDAGDINVKRLDVRVYANSAAGVWADAEGDLAADTLVSSVTLYDGNDVVDGPEGIDLTGADSTFTPGTDYYVAQFDDLNMVIPAGATETLTARVSLLKNNTATTYLALDVVPSEMTVEDDDADTVNASGNALNGTTTKSPLVTILPSGTLTASSEGNPDADILVEGSSEQLVGKYKFSAVDEDFNVKTLTIVNDTDGGDFDNAALTSAVSDIILKFPDVNGVTQTASSSLSGSGTAKFAGLDFYAPSGQDVFLEIYADVSDSDGEGASLSGKKFRLGLQNVNNTISTFEAIGQSSSINDNFSDGDEVTNSSQIEEFVVRENVPVFSQNAVSNTKLTSTTMELFDMDVTVDGSGSVNLVRMAFDIAVNNAGGVSALTLQDFVLNRDGSPVDVSDVAITKVSDGSDLSSVGGSTITADDQFIVAYLTSDPVVGSARFELEASVTGVEDSDSVTVELRDGDETVEINSMTSAANANTAQLVNAGATLGLFATGTTYQDTLTTAGALPANVVWSDTSAEPHVFSTAAAASSADFTNGYLLDVNELDPVTLSEDN